MHDDLVQSDIKNPLLYYYRWFVKYADDKVIYNYETIDDLINNKVNKFGDLDFNGIVEIGLSPLRDDLKTILLDLSPYKHAKYKKPVYWRRRVFCSGNDYPPFHIYIIGYEVNIDGKVISFSTCVYPNGTVEITDKEPKNVDAFINSLKKTING